MKLKWLQKNPLKQGRILEGWGEFFWLARIYSPAFRSNLWVAESFAGKGLVIKGKIIVFFIIVEGRRINMMKMRFISYNSTFTICCPWLSPYQPFTNFNCSCTSMYRNDWMYFVFLSWCNEIICTGFRRHARGRFGHVEYKWVVRQLLSYLKYCHISALIIIITINNIN